MPTLNGIDVLVRDQFTALHGRSIGVVCNQASIAKDGRHTLDMLLDEHRADRLKLVSAFGPQHGIWGHTQDNMIEWEGYTDERTGLPFYSLYGEVREPKREWLTGIDTLVIDIVDIGSRYYTFIWSLALSMKACEELGIRIVVLDRVNPINGIDVEGTVLDPAFKSFVGLYPLPTRHGMTAGEIALYLQATFFPKSQLEIIKVEGWDRRAYFDQTDLMWAMPSPNMPTVDTAVVYPGACLIEGTKISEGRGTTRPFEIFGAPFLDPWAYADALNALKLPGVFFRALYFEPTFQKCAGVGCGGVQVHVTDRSSFRPVLTYAAAIREAIRQGDGRFEWLEPPYEYEYNLRPIDILCGNDWLANMMWDQRPIDEISERLRDDCAAFRKTREMFVLY